MTVEQPPTGVIRVEVQCHLSSMSRDHNRVFDRVADLEEVAVKVHRMDDRALIGHPNSDVFPRPNLKRVGIRIGLSVYRPRVGLVSTARERQIERPVGISTHTVERGECLQVAVFQSVTRR